MDWGKYVDDLKRCDRRLCDLWERLGTANGDDHAQRKACYEALYTARDAVATALAAAARAERAAALADAVEFCDE